MAPTKSVLEISVFITLFLVLSQKNAEATRHDATDLLLLLTNKLQHHKQPLIIVIGKDAPLKKERARVDQALSSETSGEAVHLMHHLLGHDQLKKKAVSYKKSTTRSYYQRDETKRQRYRGMGLKDEDVLLQKDKNALRSPIVKTLLRISNDLRCNAKDECRDKCYNKFRGLRSREKKCQIQCEIKYICEEEEKEEERDDCNGNGNGDDSCGTSEEQHMSTRGVKLSTEDKNDCNGKRC